jgi:hypothetical protein
LYDKSEPYEEQTIVIKSLKITPELLKEFCNIIDEVYSSQAETYHSLNIETEYAKKSKQTITYRDIKSFLENLKLRNLSRISISYSSTNRRIWIYLSFLIDSTIVIGDSDPIRLRGLIRRCEDILEENELKFNSFINSKKAWGLYLIISISLSIVAIILLPSKLKYLGISALSTLTWWPLIFPGIFPKIETSEMRIVKYRKKISVTIIAIIGAIASILGIIQFFFPHE